MGGAARGVGIGAHRHRLGADGGQRPRGRHLVGHDRGHVLLDRQPVDQKQRRSRPAEDEVAAPVVARIPDSRGVVELQRRGLRRHGDRCDETRQHRLTAAEVHQLQLARRGAEPQPVVACRQRLGRQAGGRHVRGGAERHVERLGPRHQQHPLLERCGHLGDMGAGEVMGEDVGILPAVLGVAQRAVLREPDAVPPAMPGERERGGCLRGAGRAEGRHKRADQRRQMSSSLHVPPIGTAP